METRFWISLVIWYSSTALFGIQTRKFLLGDTPSSSEALGTEENPQSSFLRVHGSLSVSLLCLFCFLVGVGLCALLRRKEENYVWTLITWSQLPLTVNIGLAHAVGTWMTVKSLQTSGVATTYLVKACEPLTTMVLAKLISRATFSKQAVLAAFILGIGLVFSAVPLEILADEEAFRESLRNSSPAIMSNLCFSTRSVFTKIQTRQSTKTGDGGWTSIAQFQFISLLSLLLLGVFTPVLAFYMTFIGVEATNSGVLTGLDAVFTMVIIGVSHAVYSLSSFSVLRYVMPPTHSVLNVMKRISVLIVSALVSLKLPRASQFSGAVMATTGAILFWRSRSQGTSGVDSKSSPNLPEPVLLPREKLLSTWSSVAALIVLGTTGILYVAAYG